MSSFAGPSGQVAVFGNNREGQAGVGTGEDAVTSPTPVPSIEGASIVKLSSNLKQTFGLTCDGTVWTCGENDANELGRSVGKRSVLHRLEALETFRVVDVAVGEGFAILVCADGRCISWGKNESGQLGLGEGERTDVSKPRPCSILREGVLHVACGSGHSVALSKTGLVYTFGANRSGQLGDGQLTSCAAPKIVQQLKHRPVVSIACGADFSMALTVNGSVYGWGKNESGQLGLGDATTRLRPELIRPLRAARVSKIACGKAHSAAISQSTGLLFTWGANTYGQCGLGEPTAETRTVLSPRVVERLQSAERQVLDVALGATHSLLLASANGGGGGGGAKSVYVMGNGAALVTGLGTCHVPTLLRLSELEPVGVFAGSLSNHSFVFGAGCTQLQRGPLPLVDLDVLQQAATRYKACAAGSGGSGSEQEKALKYLRELVADAFGSISVLNASFRVPGGGSSADGLCIDLSKVRLAYSALLSCGSEPLLATLGRATLQVTNDLTAVANDDAENLGCFLILFESPVLLLNTTRSGMVVALERVANGICALPPSTQSLLFSWLRHYPSEYLARVILVLQGFLSYCVTSLESKIALACKVLSIVYNVNLQKHIVPDELFVNQSVCGVDLASERRRFIEAGGGGGGGSRVFNLLQFPFLLSLAVKATFLRADFVEQQALQQHKHQLRHVTSRGQSLSGQAQTLEQLQLVLPPGCIALRRDGGPWELFVELAVRRSHLLQDLLTQLSAVVLADPDTLRLPLRARFVGEDGVDQGGVRKELLSLAMRELLALTSVLVPTSSNRYLWFRSCAEEGLLLGAADEVGADEKRPRVEQPPPSSSTAEPDLRTLLAVLESALVPASPGSRGPASRCAGHFALGLLQGLAAYHGCQLDLRLPPCLYKLLGTESTASSSSSSSSSIGLQDLYDADHGLASALQALLDHQDGSTLSDTFGAVFACSANPLLGHLASVKGTQVELVPGGADVVVDKANRARFVQLFSQHALLGCVRKEAGLYLEGLRFLFHCRTIAQLCQPHELETLLCGSREIGDLSLLRLSAVYHGGQLHDEHPLSHWFWDVVSEMGNTNQRKFLQFCTGSDRVPAGGLGEVRLQLTHTLDGADSLPSAHTCFNLIDLPLSYPSRDHLESKLLMALDYASEGFGLA